MKRCCGYKWNMGKVGRNRCDEAGMKDKREENMETCENNKRKRRKEEIKDIRLPLWSSTGIHPAKQTTACSSLQQCLFKQTERVCDRNNKRNLKETRTRMEKHNPTNNTPFHHETNENKQLSQAWSHHHPTITKGLSKILIFIRERRIIFCWKWWILHEKREKCFGREL